MIDSKGTLHFKFSFLSESLWLKSINNIYIGKLVRLKEKKKKKMVRISSKTHLDLMIKVIYIFEKHRNE